MDKKRILNILKKLIIHSVALGCIVAVVLSTMFFIKYRFVDNAITKSEKYYINDIYDQPITQLKDGKTFEQEFEAHGNIFGVQIRWHNLAIVQNGTALLELVDGENGQVLASTVYNLERIVNDVYNEIAFDAPYYNDEEGYQPYILRITPTFDNPEESYLKIWGDINTGTIAFGVLRYIVNPANLYGWFGLLRKVALIGAVAAYAVCFIFKFKKELVYTVCLLAVSCLFTLALPPYSSPDEEGHFNSAQLIVNQWDGYTHDQLEENTIYKRAGDRNKIFENKYTTVLNYEYIFENLTAKSTDSTPHEFNGVWLVGDFSGVYLFGALGIKLAHILDLGYVPMMYLGRMCNLAFFALCLYFAIKITPVGKEVFMTLGLLPITLHLANSFSRDVFVISLGFLFTAYLLYLLKQEENYKWWQLLLLVAICGLLAPGKYIYVTMCLGIFLLDINKVPVLNKIKWKIHPVILLTIAAAIMLPFMLKYMLNTYPEFKWKVYAMAPLEIMLDPTLTNDFPISLQLLVDNPGYTLKLMMNTLFTNGAYYIKSIAGGVLSYNSINISDAFIFITLVVVVLSCFGSSNDSYQLKRGERVALGGIFFVVLCVVLVVCITWTFVRMETLYGLQGKYLLPALPMLLVALKGKGITVNRDLFRPMCFVMAFTDIMVALNAFVVILQR